MKEATSELNLTVIVFDLPDLRGTFSLALESYELSRLDTDYETFCRIITKV